MREYDRDEFSRPFDPTRDRQLDDADDDYSQAPPADERPFFGDGFLDEGEAP